jgi:SAM-dependent methyltransferase
MNIIQAIKTKIKRNTNFYEANKIKKVKQCYICGESFEKFSKFDNTNGLKIAADYFSIIGSDISNFGCHYCYCLDRERHLFMYFDKLLLWDNFKQTKILHFAPENALIKKITSLEPKEYIKGDLFPKDDWLKIDVCNIFYEDNYFDFIICNHVLEHVSNLSQAIQELARVLKKGGIAILQTPVSELIFNHFEDKNINTNDLRLCFYGQEDHVRIVSKRQFYEDLSAFFTLNILENKAFFSDEECFKYGVNKREDLIMVIKK